MLNFTETLIKSTFENLNLDLILITFFESGY